MKRFRVEAESGLLDRSSRPHRTPSKTSTEREDAVIAARKESRCWPARLSRATGVPERTISRILARRGLPPLAVCEPVSGAIIRATRSTAIRYERQSPGELIQVDVKKLGRIPDGGAGGPMADRRRSAGEASDSTTSLQPSMTTPGWPTPRSTGRKGRSSARNSGSLKAHCPWTNGKIERFNRTLATEWAYAKAFASNTERAAALDPWLNYYNTERIHAAIKGPPITRVTLT